MTPLECGPLTLHAQVPEPFSLHWSAHEAEAGLWEIALSMEAAEPTAPQPLVIRWSLPCVDLLGQWRGDSSGLRGMFPPDWGKEAVNGRACAQSPVLCLHGQDGSNRLCVALGDGVHLSRLLAGVHEEDGTMHCRAEVFSGPRPAARKFRTVLRLDLRPQPWDMVLAAVARWWETDYPPLAVPEAARRPMYSTWYSLHQQVEAERVLPQCLAAKALGCEAVIIDDGWQTLDSGRGYAFCGDWAPERIPDMAGLVRRLHEQGMKTLLWYAVPFVGLQSAAYQRFADRCLFSDQRKGAALLDPRFPEVRDFLVNLYENAVRDWNLDGLKLDFVDAFILPPESDGQAQPGMDFHDLNEAVMALLQEVTHRLRAIKPDILIEFRQSYIGPAMRQVGNIFRAGDCPADAIGNRMRVLDLRLLAGASAVHSDMLMWHRDEPVESAALQLLNILFAVPQVSVDLLSISAQQRSMLEFWLSWWNAHRDCLLDGELRLFHPELRYARAEAQTSHERIICLYLDTPATISLADGDADAPQPTQTVVINVTRSPGIVLEWQRPWRGRVLIRDCCGTICSDEALDLQAGLRRLPVPAAGLVELQEERLSHA